MIRVVCLNHGFDETHSYLDWQVKRSRAIIAGGYFSIVTCCTSCDNKLHRAERRWRAAQPSNADVGPDVPGGGAV